MARRARVLRALLCVGLTILAARAAQLAIAPDARLEPLAQRQYTRALELAPRRGAILDRTGDVLAQSVEVDSIYVNPRKYSARLDAGARKRGEQSLAKALGIPASQVHDTLTKDRAFVWLDRQVDPDEAEAVLGLELPGVGTVKESKRFYPHVELAAHLMGFAGLDMKGLEGVEREYDALLRADGKRFVRARDARGRAYADGLFVDADATGDDLTLTVDARIQYLTEVALRRGVVNSRAKAGFAIVQEPSTGRILAMANQPTFNPNAFQRHEPRQWRNRAVADLFEPGSTLKTVVMAAALDSGAIQPDQIFYCEQGSIEVADAVIRDGGKHGWLPPARILQFSSNIGMIKIARELGAERLAAALANFGFGAPTGVDLPGEGAGLLPPVRSWSSVRLATVAFGQGVSVTGIQLVTAVSAIANGGVLMKPYVIERATTAEGSVVLEQSPTVVRRVLSPTTAAEVTQMMERVTQTGGTGPAAALDRWSVAGKTGTAQKVDPVAGGYSRENHIASFVGFTPASAPRITILVVIDEPRTSSSGGRVAAPVFHEIADGVLRYLQVEPDQNRPVADRRPAHSDGERERALARVSAQAALARASASAPGTLPDFRGLTIRSALRAAEQRQLLLEVSGHGVAVRQKPLAGTSVEPGQGVRVWFEAERGGRG